MEVLLRRLIRERIRSARGRHLSRAEKDAQLARGEELEAKEKSAYQQKRHPTWQDGTPNLDAEPWAAYKEKSDEYEDRKAAGLTSRWDKPPKLPRL